MLDKNKKKLQSLTYWTYELYIAQLKHDDRDYVTKCINEVAYCFKECAKVRIPMEDIVKAMHKGCDKECDFHN